MSDICDGCPGLCCRCFGLPYSPEELKKKAEIEIEVKGMSNSDIQFAAKNLIYLGEFKKNPLVSERTGNGYLRDYYTCRQLGLNGKCLVYENRPPMCVSYGVNYPAGHIGCRMPLITAPRVKEKEKTNENVTRKRFVE